MPEHPRVPVRSAAGRLEFDRAVPLFRAPIAEPGWGRNHYQASADGQRFLVNVLLPRERSQSQVVVVLEWADAMHAALQQRSPAGDPGLTNLSRILLRNARGRSASRGAAARYAAGRRARCPVLTAQGPSQRCVPRPPVHSAFRIFILHSAFCILH
jgi:hypothetical protein